MQVSAAEAKASAADSNHQQTSGSATFISPEELEAFEVSCGVATSDSAAQPIAAPRPTKPNTQILDACSCCSRGGGHLVAGALS
jgi:hypothetical protein